MNISINFELGFRNENLDLSSKSTFNAGFSPLKLIFIFFNENPLKVMENAFHFILKILFVLNKFKLLSRLFGNVEKMA